MYNFIFIIIPIFLLMLILLWAILQWKNFSGCKSTLTQILKSDIEKTETDIKLQNDKNNQILKTFDLFNKFKNEACNIF